MGWLPRNPEKAHPLQARTAFTVQEVPYEVILEGIAPDGRLEYGAWYVVLAFGVLPPLSSFHDWSPEGTVSHPPHRLNMVDAMHEELHTQPYNGRVRQWDIIGLIQLVDIYNARMVEWRNRPERKYRTNP